MVQVLPYVPSFGEKLSEAVAGASGNIAHAVQKKYATTALQKLLTPQTVMQAGSSAAQQMSPMQSMQQVQSQNQTESRLSPMKLMHIYDLAEKAVGPEAAKQLSGAYLKQQALQEKEAQDIRKEERNIAQTGAKEFLEKIESDRLKISEEEFSSQMIIDAIMHGDTDPFSGGHIAELAKSFGVPDSLTKILETPGSKEFKTARKTFIGNTIKDAFRGTTSKVEINLAEDMLAELGVSKEGNLASAWGIQAAIDIRKERIRLTDQLKEQGVPASKLPSVVDKMMQPYIKETKRAYFEDLKSLRKRSKGKSKTEDSEPPTPPNRFLAQIEGVQFPEKEGAAKSIARSLLQAPLGLAQKYTWPLNLLQMSGQGDALAELDELEERLPDLMKQFPDAPWENFKGIDREKYMRAVQAAGDIFPTQQNAERLIEEKTGAPLTPQNRLEKIIRLSSGAAGFRNGGLSEKATAALTAPAVSEGLRALGVPEGLAEGVGLGASGVAPAPNFSKAIKPSGMTTRRFEEIKKPTKISANRHEVINKAVEGDFKKIADQLLEKNKTYSAMKEDSLFKEKIGSLFEDVEGLASDVDGSVHSEDLRNAFKKRYNNRDTKGISPDEFERSFRKEVRGILKEIPYDNLSAPELVEQFRKNNKSLKELFEPGKSSAFNRAKREALLEYNRSIEDVITKKYPDTEFKDIFEFTNKRWQEINDIEQINNFSEDLFKGEIDYSKAKQIFNRGKEHIQKPFKRILGEKGFEDFKGLTEDLLSTEKSMGYIKKAKDAGFDELAKTASLYLVSNKAGAARTLSKVAKSMYQMLLDKPQLRTTWKKAYSNLKEGNYKEAQRYFSILNSEVTKGQNSTQE